MNLQPKHLIGWILIVFGAYEILWAQIPSQGGNALETVSSGSCTIGGVISSEISSGQMWLGGGSIGAGLLVLRYL